MKTLTFKYTKRDGSVSERTLLSFIQPTDKYAGIDVSELEPETAAEFIAEMLTLESEYKDFQAAIISKYELSHSYRQFLKDGVSELTEI